MKSIITSLLFLGTLSFSAQHNIVKESYYIKDIGALNLIKSQYDLTIDHASQDGFEVYGPEGLKQFLIKNSIPFEEPQIDKNQIDDYPSPEQIEKELEAISLAYPDITQLIEIGKSVKGRKLLFLKISDNAKTDETEPEFKFISSMHGDEIVGRELMVKLIQHLASQYGKDEEITSLINNTEIYIMPSMNPDGSHMRQRGNAQFIDLNRDFPDFSTSDNKDDPKGRATETQVIMNFQKTRQFAFSANFHGGAECVSYLWDTLVERHPFDSLIQEFSLEYALKSDYIFKSHEFKNGITNGYDWYEVNGGMQDWSTHWYHDMQTTIELSQIKWSPYSNVSYYFDKNLPAFISFIKRVHNGAGFFLNEKNISGQVVIYNVKGEKLSQDTYRNSEFYKVLPVGHYKFEVEAGNNLINFEIEVKNEIHENGNYFSVNL